MKIKNPWIALGILVVVLVGGSVGYAQFAVQQANQGVEVQDHVKGNPEAEVVLVEYSDFECPACAAFHPMVVDIMDRYGDDIRFEYRHFPVINRNPQVLLAAEAAGQQDRFFEYHDLLFENHEQWSQSRNVDRFLEQYAEELDLDMGLWTQHRRASLLRGKVQDDFARGRADGVTGTPTFILNGEIVPLETMGDLLFAVEEALGVPPSGGQQIQLSPEDFQGADGEPIELDLGELEAVGEGDGEIELEI